MDNEETLRELNQVSRLPYGAFYYDVRGDPPHRLIVIACPPEKIDSRVFEDEIMKELLRVYKDYGLHTYRKKDWTGLKRPDLAMHAKQVMMIEAR